MSEPKTHVRYLMESRVVSRSSPDTTWTPSPEKYKTLEQAEKVRDEFAMFLLHDKLPSGKPLSPILHNLLALMSEMIQADGGTWETRIVKRTMVVTDEVLDLEKVTHG